MTVKTARVMNSELTSQMTKKLDEIKLDLNSQILQAIVTAIAENVHPQLQKSLVVPEAGLNKASTGLRRNTEAISNNKMNTKNPKGI